MRILGKSTLAKNIQALEILKKDQRPLVKFIVENCLKSKSHKFKGIPDEQYELFLSTINPDDCEKFRLLYNMYDAEKTQRKKYYYNKIKNMGIVILPNLLEKIETGDSDLIPMFCYLSDSKELKNAGDCKKWWDANKDKYENLLNY